MPEHFSPETESHVVDAVRWAMTSSKALEVQSRGTKRGIGAFVALDATLDLSNLRGVKLYEPDELILRAGPGTSLDEVEALLDEQGQMLPFEPPRFAEAGGTLGGIVGTNISGPRRFKAGAVRDYILGVRGVSGFAEPFKSGGRVVKNVSGYDLSKLMTGSFGTLAAMTEITLKVLPRPESELTFAARAESDEAAMAAMTALAGSALEPSGLALIPAPLSSGIGSVDGEGSALIVRLEGPRLSLEERVRGVEQLVQVGGSRLEREASAALWKELRDASIFDARGSLWRVSVPPASSLRAVAANRPDEWFLDWAGGLVWMRFDDARRSPVVEAGGGVRVRCDVDALRDTPAFTPLPEGVQRLSARIKASFDPKNVLNPGRMGESVVH